MAARLEKKPISRSVLECFNPCWNSIQPQQDMEGKMKSKVVFLAASVFILAGCMVRSTPRGGLEIVPILPTIVEIDDDSYYEHGGYHYFYTNERWYYSDRSDGARRELPRDHWPRETRHRSHDLH